MRIVFVVLERAHIVLDGVDNLEPRFLPGEARLHRGLPSVYVVFFGLKDGS
jgi:hypothetical protein